MEPPSIEKNYLDKIKTLELKNKFLENENQLQKDYINSLKEQIDLLKEKISNLEKKSNIVNTPSNIINTHLPYTLSPEFQISEAEPIHFLSKNHSQSIYCITLLKNKRLVSGSQDSKIIVYDKNYIKPDLEIIEHTNAVTSLIVSSNGNLISSSSDKTIKIFKIEEINNKNNISLKYYLLQTINTTHSNHIIHVREINSYKLASCSMDTQINFYLPQNSLYSLESTINVSSSVFNILEVLDNKLVLALSEELKLFDIKTRAFTKELKDVKCYPDWVNDNLCLLKDNYLSICGKGFIYIVDLIQFKTVNKLNTKSDNICLLFLNNILFAGSNNGIIQEFIVKDFSLIKISYKEKCHQSHIWQIIKDEEGNLISCSSDNYIKVWNKNN